ncbi:hypothetical protein D3C86_1521760 [compost metagenome]
MQFEHHAVAAVGADLGHVTQHGLGRRGGFLAEVVLDRSDHVVGGQGLAVVEGHALTDFEGPDARVRGRGPAFCQLGDGRAVDGNFGQGVIDRREADEGEGVGPGARVLGVRGAATGQAQTQNTAGFWRGLPGKGAKRQPHGERPGHRCGSGAVLEEVSTRKTEFMVRLSNLVFVIAHCIAPDQKLMEFQFKTTQSTGPRPGAYNV